jgi:hypothetical protein
VLFALAVAAVVFVGKRVPLQARFATGETS